VVIGLEYHHILLKTTTLRYGVSRDENESAMSPLSKGKVLWSNESKTTCQSCKKAMLKRFYKLSSLSYGRTKEKRRKGMEYIMKNYKGALLKYPISHHPFGGFSTKDKKTYYKGKTVENVDVKIKCPFCDNIIATKFVLEECTCVYNPEIQKYEVTHSIHCYKCGNEVKNVTITLGRKKGWSVS